MEILRNLFMEYSYYAAFTVLIICGLGIPFPEDITLITAGIITGLGYANVHLMAVICYLGVILGDWIMFAVGAYYGWKLVYNPWFSKFITVQRITKVEGLFSKYGNRLLFFARFMPGLRSPVYILAGMNKNISFLRFTFIDGFAALLSVPILVYLGYYGASNMDWLSAKIQEFKYLSMLLVAGFVISMLYVYWRYRRRIIFFRRQRQRLRMRQRNQNKQTNNLNQ